MNNSVSILHLSDLHICKSSSDEYSEDLKILISDITEQLIEKHITKLIIIVSGDIIDKGEIKYIDTAIRFFHDLFEAIRKECPNVQIADIQIVPGNHDIKRSHERDLLALSHRNLDLSIQEDWKYYLGYSSEYISMVNKIYNMINKGPINNTFGCEIVKNGLYNICFIRLDSAWSACTDNDVRNIRFGSYQIKQILDEYNKLKSKDKIDVTIAISHHPTSWLHPNDEELFKQFAMQKKYLDVDIHLCGHTHNLSVENYYNHEHSLLTLVTGIGWGEKKRPTEINNYRYSIYTLNIARNCCEIFVRKTKRDSTYDYDLSIYSPSEKRTKKIMYPIKMLESFTFIQTNTLSEQDVTGIYVDMSILEKIPNIIKSSIYFQELMSITINNYKDEFRYSFSVTNGQKNIQDDAEQENYDNFEIINRHFENVQQKNEKRYVPSIEIKSLMQLKDSNQRFESYLNDVIRNVLEAYKNCFSNNLLIRGHFRRYHSSVNTINYSWLCSACSDHSIHESSRDLPWQSLVQTAYKQKRSIVFSTNYWGSPIVTDWNDYITLVPRFSGYEVIENYGIESEYYPLLSFGLSLGENYVNEDSLALHLLSFTKFENLISKAINEYVETFCFDIGAYLKYKPTEYSEMEKHISEEKETIKI